MRNPGRKALLALAGLAVAITMFWLAVTERTGAEDSWSTVTVGMGGLTLLAVCLYYAVAGALAARGSARLRAGFDVVARWQVPPADWDRFRAIGLADTGVSLPLLKDLHFHPRRVTPPEGVEIIAGQRGVLIDECFFAVAPGKANGLESAGWAKTSPPCIALVIRNWTRTPSSSTTSRWLLLLPVPWSARTQGEQALAHYRRAIDGIVDLGVLAFRYPARARWLFWTVLAISAAAGALGFWLEIDGMPGDLPAYLGITGTMVALATLLLGFVFLPRRRW